jgi:acyl-[acyl-carrier-protein]-phospholipid O-acyltransferase / long-chain-fatty-acid--[acyl-carrier-protein] ligase
MMMILLRWFVRALLRVLFGFRVYGENSLRTPGPVLLVPNHVSWLDWLFLGVCLDEDWRVVVSSTAAETSWVHRWIMINRRTFPVDTASPYAAKHMAEHLAKGGRLVLFAEGRISRTGCLMKLFEGTGFLLNKTRPQLITGYLRGAERVLFSPHPGWHRLFPRVTLHLSEPMTPPHAEHETMAAVRTRLTRWLRDRMLEQRFQVEMNFGEKSVLEAVNAAARQRPGQVVLQDASMRKLTYRRLLMGADLIAGGLEPSLATTRGRVGVLLPNVLAMPVVLLSLWRLGKVPAILNYTTGAAVMRQCAELAELQTVITSRQFIDRAKLDVGPLKSAGLNLVYLEDVRAGLSLGAKLLALARSYLRPGAGGSKPPPANSRQVAVVLFTSGSEGSPKGVELTHANLLANVQQGLAVLDVMDTDRFFNALPLFHSFGLLAGLLLPLVRGVYTFLYVSPLHYRQVPTAFYGLDCTVMFGTNTFLNGYARKAHPYDFRSLRYLLAGAEKLQDATVDLWARKFGIRPMEGYGVTECSPVLSVNTAIEPRIGSAGRLVPGVEYRLDPVEGIHEGGRLLVRGPNIMRGYLNPKANEEFKALQGWYDTGDIARVDEERFVFILGRLKRFAKISGEMISLTAVEDVLAGAFPQHSSHCEVAVLSRPDPGKGEALVAVTNEPKLQLDEIRAAMRGKGWSNLAVPRELKVVDEIPKLGSGKVNYRGLAALFETDGDS